MENSPTAKAENVSLNALYRSGKALMHQKGPDDSQTVLVEVEKLKTSRFQKRVITPDRVRQLAETIRNNGLLQPVTARQVGDELELIAGHRRREAFRLLLAESESETDRAKWSRIPCIIRLGLSDLQTAALAAVENLERDDGDPLEQGLSLLEVKKVGGFANNGQVAEATGMSAQRVTRLVRLAEAPEVIQQAVTPGLLVDFDDKGGGVRKERRRLDLTVALGAFGYYRFVEREHGVTQARERTEKLLGRAAKGDWTRVRLEAEVKRVTGGRSGEPEEDAGSQGDDSKTEADGSPKEPTKRLLFRDRGDQWVLYRKNLERAERGDLERLVEKLRALLGEAEATLSAATPDGSNHR